MDGFLHFSPVKYRNTKIDAVLTDPPPHLQRLVLRNGTSTCLDRRLGFFLFFFYCRNKKSHFFALSAFFLEFMQQTIDVECL